MRIENREIRTGSTAKLINFQFTTFIFIHGRIMVFEIPEDVNNYDLIVVSVIEQAAQDSRSSNPHLAKKARQWLECEGRTWWETMGLDNEIFNKLVLEKEGI
jgi:hypothetical protein